MSYIPGTRKQQKIPATSHNEINILVGNTRQQTDEQKHCNFFTVLSVITKITQR